MKAVVCREAKAKLKVEEVDVPEPAEGQVLLRVLYCGICHTDIHAIEGDWPVKATMPLIPGHEIIGEVVKLGKNISRLKEGEVVGVAWLHDACGFCSYCQTGRENLCPEQHNSGYSVAGGYAQYTVADEKFAIKIPKGVDYLEAAPILCAGVTTYKALKETEAKPGEWVTIVGLGGLGHIGVMYALAMGFRVIGVDVKEESLKLCKELGAEIVLNPEKQNVAEEIQKAVGGCHGIVVTAASPKAFSSAIQCVRRGGTVVCVGLPSGEFPTPIFDIVLKRITIRGSIVGTRHDLEEAFEFASRGKIKTHIDSTVSLDEAPAAVEKLKSGKITGRVVIKF
jgi:propanol-preferring alcohol dehydrogenase